MSGDRVHPWLELLCMDARQALNPACVLSLPAERAGALNRLPALAASAATAAARTPAPASAARCAESTAAAGGLGPRFVHVHGAAVQLGAVQLRDRRLGIASFRHFDKCESARLTAVAIRHDVHALHVPVLGKYTMQLVLSSPIAEVPYKDVGHRLSFEIESCLCRTAEEPSS